VKIRHLALAVILLGCAGVAPRAVAQTKPVTAQPAQAVDPLTPCMIRGRIYDAESGETMPYTNIYLAGTNYGTMAFTDGLYMIRGLPAGTYNVKASYISYALGSQTVTLHPGETINLDFRLEIHAILQDTYEVAAERQIIEVEKTGSSHYMSAQQLQAVPLDQMVDMIALQPGVTMQDNEIHIRGGRHPVVEKIQGAGAFVANDCTLDCTESRLHVLTGPNMSGKSTALRQVALIVLLAQVGSFVPAEEARIGVVDRIFTRIGAHDELATGQSTFMVEMNETANILNNATRRSLVILDEIGRGTSTYDGLSIAWAVVEHLAGIGCRTLFATHYHHLNELAGRMPGIRNYRVAVKEKGDQIVWLHKLVPGGTDKSYGIQVARMAGVPTEVIRRAKEVLASLEKTSARAAGDVVAPGQAIATSKKKLQLTLFDLDRHPALEELDVLDTAALTPIEALIKLDELQRMARGS
jgi:energy-coupling factor transporter ATP-binding protein EcfA2